MYFLGIAWALMSTSFVWIREYRASDARIRSGVDIPSQEVLRLKG